MMEISTTLNLVLVSILILSGFVFYQIFSRDMSFFHLSFIEQSMAIITLLILASYIYAWFQITNSPSYQLVSQFF